VERRERNREHAKKSRIRKRVLLDLLQDQLSGLRGENVKLRRVVLERLPHVASKVLQSCTTEESMLLMFEEDSLADKGIRDAQGAFQLHMRQHSDEIKANPQASPFLGTTPPKQIARILMEPDFRLIEALIHSQQNFVLSDPSLPDNPIVYCSEGFCKLTGYKRQHILGRNCRFLQGPGTDQAAVDIIRKGVMEGCDISVCLLNYKADGSPFWNQFFVAALKDSEGGVVNYVGVQCEVNTFPIQGLKKRVKSLPVPMTVHPKV
jgi:PAS domain S-box-containing protein